MRSAYCPICKFNFRVTDLAKKVSSATIFKCPECKTSLMYFDTGKGISVYSIEMSFGPEGTQI